MAVFVFAVYALIPAPGVTALWIAYQVRFKSRLTLIRSAGKPVPAEMAQRIAPGFSVMCAVLGIASLAFAVAIPVYGIRWGTWHFYLGFLASLGGAWYHILHFRARRSGQRRQ